MLKSHSCDLYVISWMMEFDPGGSGTLVSHLSRDSLNSGGCQRVGRKALNSSHHFLRKDLSLTHSVDSIVRVCDVVLSKTPPNMCPRDFSGIYRDFFAFYVE